MTTQILSAPIRWSDGTFAPRVWSLLDSSAIHCAAYVPGAGHLYVEFVNDTFYRYDAVPPNIYDGLLAAESAGRYLNQCIRPHYAGGPVS